MKIQKNGLNKLLKIWTLIMLLVLPAGKASTQEKIYVVSQKIERVFIPGESCKLHINTERGIIVIRSGKENQMKVTMNIVAKNKDQETARKELKYMQYSLSQNRNEILIRNYLLLPAQKDLSDISSIIRVEYEIQVPDNSNISVSNSFGTLQIDNLDVSLDASLEYCDISLDHITGNAKLDINVGDIQCTNSTLTGTFKTNYSSIGLNNVSGSLTLITRFGDIKADLNGDLSLLDVNANRTEIFLINRDCQLYNLTLKSEFGNVNISKSCYGIKAGNTPDKSIPGQDKFTLESPSPSAKRTLRINSVYGNITLN